MKVLIKGRRGLRISKDLRFDIEEKVLKYEKLVMEPSVCEVVLEDIRGSKNGVDKIVTITLVVPDRKNPIFVCERTSDFISSIDLAQERLEQQIIKYKERVKIGSRFPAKYWLAKMYEKSIFGPKWLAKKFRRRSKE